MIEIEQFYNNGLGWICKRCDHDAQEEAQKSSNKSLPRVWREGEAESKQPQLSAPIAKWLDPARTQLVCPRCGVSEATNKA